MTSIQSTYKLNNPRIEWLSRRLKALTSLGMFTIVGFCLGLLIVPEWLETMITAANPELRIYSLDGFFRRTALIVLYAIPLGITFYGLWNVRLLFDCYARGEIFSPVPANAIRKIGLAMAINAIASILVNSVASVLLTYDNPPNAKQLTVGFSSNVYLLLLLGGLLVVIGWVMHEASRVSDENQKFI